MQQFRKKPVVIEAVKWTGDNFREVIRFTGLHPSARKYTWAEYEDLVRREGLKIFTLEGSHKASIGDMIIRGVHGEYYPCKPDIFEATYESVDEGLADPKGDVISKAQRILTEYLVPDGVPADETLSRLLDLLDGPECRDAMAHQTVQDKLRPGDS